MNTATADAWKLLVRDYVTELLSDVRTLKADAQQNDAFEIGRRTAYYELLDRLRQEIEAFGLDANEIGLDMANLEREIL